MNKNEFIKELSKETGYGEKECMIINDILENNFFLSKKNKEKIINEIASNLGIDMDESENIYNLATTIINNEVKNKLKHPFRNLDK